MVKLFLYGTLQSGERNAHKLPKGKRRRAVLENYKLIMTGRAPKIIPSQGSRVAGELATIRLSRWQLLRLDLFEYKYKRTLVEVEGEKCWTYVWRKGFKVKVDEK